MKKTKTPEHNIFTTRLSQNQVPFTESFNSEDISLSDLVLILWKGKYVITTCTIIATVIGVIYALTATEIFSSSTTFILKTKRSGGSNLGQLAAMAGFNMGSNNNVNPSDYLDKIVQDKVFIAKLYEKKWFFKGDSLPLEQIYEIEPDTTVNNWEYAYEMAKVENIRRNNVIKVNKDKKTDILTLIVNAPGPQLAFDLNRYCLDIISNYIRNSLKIQAKEKRQFIEERIKETKKELARNEEILAKFKEGNLANQSPKIALEETRLIRKVTLNQEIYIQFQKQYELTRIEELDDQTLIQIIINPDVPFYRSAPKRKQLVIFSCFIGFFIGGIIPFISTFYKKYFLSKFTGKTII